MRATLAVWLGLMLTSTPAVAQDCPRDIALSDLDVQFDTARLAYEQLETDAFLEGVEGALLELPCLVEPMDAPHAAALHRLTGIHRFTRRDEEAALASLRAARWLDPTYVFPDALLPPQHALRVSYEGMQITDPAGTPLPRPQRGIILIDGQPANSRPTDRGSVFQLIDPDGPVRLTAYLYPGDATPSYALKPRKRTALAIAAGSLAVGAGALYGGAWSTRAQFDATPTSQTDDLKRLQLSTNAMTGTAIGLATAALANAIAAIAVGKR